jgi:predicted phosphoadenosine phosphosulfate sulfurtransferase
MEKLREKRYLEQNVLDAAKDRLRYLIDQFDSLWVSFSGGKDSLVVLTLLEEVYREQGITEKINVIFRDEELISTTVVDFVSLIHDSGKYNLHWLAVPMKGGKYIMGRYLPFTCWDPSRKWHRQPPAYAVRSLGTDTSQLDEYSFDEATFAYFNPKGRVAILTGVRADESLKRFMGVTCKVADNYISRTTKKTWMAKPIYDWTETDVFKWFYDAGIDYCPVYDLQAWAGSQLRVSTVTHDRARSQLYRMKAMEPEFYQSLIEVMPEIETTFRYGEDVDYDALMRKFPPTMEGCLEFAKTYVGPELRDDAVQYVTSAMATRKDGEARGLPLGHMAVLRVYRAISSGSFWGNAPLVAAPSEEDFDFEQAR